MHTRSYFVGLDLGQRQDYTAVAVLERADEDAGLNHETWERRSRRRYGLRHLKRLPLGTEYVEVVEHVRLLTARLCHTGRFPFDAVRGDGDPRCAMAVDATGVGLPVVELLRAAIIGCEITAVVITGGDAERRSGGLARVPKRNLVSGLQVMMGTGALRVASGMKEAAALAEELAGMRVRVTSAGHEQFNAWRDGKHDDLVLAAALACWRARKGDYGEKREGRLV